MTNTRELIVDMLMEILEKGNYSHLVVREVLDKYNYLETNQKAFLKQVTEGTLERKLQLDYILDAYSSVPTEKMKPFIRILLEMSVYQILFLSGIPDSAVCNEAVKLAEKRQFGALKGFVNGVLRTVSRQKAAIHYPDREKEPVAYLSVCYSCPRWIVEKWLSAYGFERTESMLQALLTAHPVSVRFSEQMTEAEKTALIEKIEQAGVLVEKQDCLPYAYWFQNTGDVTALPGFADGRWTIQDTSSMWVAECSSIRELLAKRAADTSGRLIQERVRVFDLCAAPGGKAMHIAGMERTGVDVYAWDIKEEKVLQIESNALRMGTANVKVDLNDARKLMEGRVEQADIVLADVPCSGLGVIGKKRDIKYRVKPEDIVKLTALQREILATASRYVKPGGYLLYSTCTISREENEENAEWFAQNHSFRPVSLEDVLPADWQNGTAKKGYVQFLPGAQHCDGFFLAKFQKER